MVENEKILIQPNSLEADRGVVSRISEWARQMFHRELRECSTSRGVLVLFRQIVSEEYPGYGIVNIRSFTDGTSFCFISNGEERHTIRLDDSGWKLVKVA